MKNCPLCGTTNDDTNTVCYDCGTDLGYQNQVLYEIATRATKIDQNISAIKGWVTFLGILALIGLLLSLFGGCAALL